MEGGDAKKGGEAPLGNAAQEVTNTAGIPATPLPVPPPTPLLQLPAPPPKVEEAKKGQNAAAADKKGKGKATAGRGHSRERKEALNRAPSPKDKHCDKPGDKPADKNKEQAKKTKADKTHEAAKKKTTKKKAKQPPAKHEKPINFIDCPICHKVFKFAVEIDCGHVFCSTCLKRKMGRQRKCPICKSDVDYIHPSYVMRELVRKFGVRDGAKRLKAALLQVPGYYDEYTMEDPIVIATQFVPDPAGGCCSSGGAFDPADLYKVAKLDEYVSIEEYLDTIKMVNQIIATWTSGAMKSCFGSICCCFLPSAAQSAVNMIEVVLGDCNLRWPETGLFWTLMYQDGDATTARTLSDRFYLTMRIDRSKARNYQHLVIKSVSGYKKDIEMGRLRKQNALMRHKMLELGENGLVRALAGRKSPRYSLKTGPSLMFTDDYPDFHVISPHTLRDLVLHHPTSKKHFIPPWNRLRSTSTGPLPLNRDEDCRMRSQLHSIVSLRCHDPQRTPSPCSSRPKSPTGEKLRPWR